MTNFISLNGEVRLNDGETWHIFTEIMVNYWS